MQNKSFLFLLCLFFFIPGFSQLVEGTVFDHETKEPLQGATVYFDGTTIVTITDSEGNFKINGGANANNTLVITFVGYHPYRIERPSEFAGKKVRVMLGKNSTELDEVVIGKGPFSRKQMLECFRSQFLGSSKAALSCKIQNEDDLVLFFDVDNNTLTATARNPLKIRNAYLEYEINFDLVDFSSKFNARTLSPFNNVGNNFSGTTFFKDISKKEKIYDKRLKTFLGSAPHLMRSMAYETLEQEGFEVYVSSFEVDPKTYFQTSDTLGVKKIKLIKEPLEPIKDANISLGTSFRTIKTADGKTQRMKKTFINILYKREQQSIVDFAEKEIIVDQDGNYAPIYGILFGGHLGSLKAGDMLPRDFYQSVKTKTNN